MVMISGSGSGGHAPWAAFGGANAKTWNSEKMAYSPNQI